MTAGTHYITDGSSTKAAASNQPMGYTFGTDFTPSRTVTLKSIVTRFNTSGNWNGAARVYNSSTQASVYSEAASSRTVTTGGVDTEIVLTGTPPTLTAGVQYRICLYSSSGPIPSLLTPFGASWVSTPAGVTGSLGGSYNLYVSGNAFPSNDGTNTYGMNLPWQGFYVDVPNTLPVVSAVTPTGTVTTEPTRINWTYSDANSDAQTQYEVGRRLTGTSTWTTVTNTSVNKYHDFAPGTFADGSTYDLQVRVNDGIGWSSYATSTFTYDSWIYLTEVPSSSPSGYIDATAFIVGDYDVEVRVAETNGYGLWSSVQTVTIGPASNVSVRVGGVWKQAAGNTRISSAWKSIPPTKKYIGGIWS